MLIPTMDISHIMVHAEQIKEQNLKQVGRDLKKTKVEDGNPSKTWFKVHDKARFKKKFSNQGPLKTPRVNKGKGYMDKY